MARHPLARPRTGEATMKCHLTNEISGYTMFEPGRIASSGINQLDDLECDGEGQMAAWFNTVFTVQASRISQFASNRSAKWYLMKASPVLGFFCEFPLCVRIRLVVTDSMKFHG